MNASVSMQEGLYFPWIIQSKWLAGMISAYFDDSGTHGTSDIVSVSGLLGTEGRLRGLDCGWKRHLDHPLDGTKPPLKRFHMYECQNSLGEFSGWSRTETDYFCHQLRQTIIDSGVSAYGAACSRKDWDELVSGDLRAILGTAEGFSIRNCFIRAVAWAQRNTFDPKMTFIFDRRPDSVKRDADAVFDAFKRETQEPTLVGISFLSSYDVCPLQAADLLAWEFYQYANGFLQDGLDPPQRKEFAHLTKNMAFAAQFASRKSIEDIVAFWAKEDPDTVRRVANHFTFFDPENPDYSYLSGGPPLSGGRSS
jgi:hypothetical protein